MEQDNSPPPDHGEPYPEFLLSLKSVRFGSFLAEHRGRATIDSRKFCVNIVHPNKSTVSLVNFLIAFRHVAEIKYHFSDNLNLLFMHVSDYCMAKIRGCLAISDHIQSVNSMTPCFNPKCQHSHHKFITFVLNENDGIRLLEFFEQNVEPMRLKMAQKEGRGAPLKPLLTSLSAAEAHSLMDATRTPFMTPGQCSVPDCEVTLKFDHQQCLYVCKHTLASMGDYFKTMFSGNFKEKHQSEIAIQEVSRTDMLLFVQFTAPVKYETRRNPSNISELYTLISLADRFLYSQLSQDIVAYLPEWVANWSPTVDELCQLFSLGDRLDQCNLNQAIAKHIVCTKAIDGKTSKFKMALVEAAETYQGDSTAILDGCIRLCANLEISDVAELNGKVSTGTVVAIYDMIGKATPRLSDAPEHTAHPHRGSHSASKRFDCLKLTSDRRWWWRCTTCKSDREATLPFENIMQLEVKKVD